MPGSPEHSEPYRDSEWYDDAPDFSAPPRPRRAADRDASPSPGPEGDDGGAATGRVRRLLGRLWRPGGSSGRRDRGRRDDRAYRDDRADPDGVDPVDEDRRT